MQQRSVSVSPGSGDRFVVLGGDEITIKVTGEDTNGAMTILETTVPAGAGPPRHMHSRESETFYVLEGEFEFEIDGEIQTASAGSLLIAPPDLPHQFRNTTSEPGKLLILCQPAGFEKFVMRFAELPIDQPPDPSKIAEIGAEFGITFLPPAE